MGYVTHMQQRILLHLTRGTAIGTAGVNLYMGLHCVNALSDPAPDLFLGGNDFIEPTAGGYTRKFLDGTKWDATPDVFDTVASSSFINASPNSIDFPVATARWGFATHWGLFLYANDTDALSDASNYAAAGFSLSQRQYPIFIGKIGSGASTDIVAGVQPRFVDESIFIRMTSEI